MRRAWLWVVLALAACAPAPPYRVTTPFVEQEYRPYGRGGSATITGQAFLKTVGGDVKTCAGETVILLPATSYARELLRAGRAGFRDIANLDPRMKNYAHSTVCDAQGNFTFEGLAPLPWIVEADVNWSVPTGGDIVPHEHQSGALVKEVKLRPGGNRVLLTGADEL